MKRQSAIHSKPDRELLHGDFDLEIAPEFAENLFSQDPQSYPHPHRSEMLKKVKNNRKTEDIKDKFKF